MSEKLMALNPYVRKDSNQLLQFQLKHLGKQEVNYIQSKQKESNHKSKYKNE